MSLDKSLKSKNALRRHRNVLSRAERVERMVDEEKWTEGQSAFALPKTKVRRIVAKKAKAVKAEEALAEGEVPAEGAAAAAPAKG